MTPVGSMPRLSLTRPRKREKVEDNSRLHTRKGYIHPSKRYHKRKTAEGRYNIESRIEHAGDGAHNDGHHNGDAAANQHERPPVHRCLCPCC